MPFEPRLIGEEAEADFDSLSEDLAALGEQLSADARWLAERYAPAEIPAAPAVSVRAWYRWPTAKAASAAVVLVAAGFLSVSGWRAWNGHVPHVADRGPFAAAPGDNSDPAGKANSIISLGATVVGFEDLSAPQQEAVLDLWELRVAESPSLSI